MQAAIQERSPAREWRRAIEKAARLPARLWFRRDADRQCAAREAAALTAAGSCLCLNRKTNSTATTSE